ncbi:MAG: SpoIIE family protein phosphatase, partial [Bacteroidota bacterium]|nr:SpoIIE family protein phosphatase [Bacteroidota bacterium]
PKDIVSGDFYWYAKKEGCLILVVGDCTGHGVPGAFMSMIGNDQLNQIIIEKGEKDPARILSLLNKSIKSALKQSSAHTETKDGMDIIILTFYPNENKVSYAGAYRSLFSINSKNEVVEISADKTSIGGGTDINYPFKSHDLPLIKGDSFYLFSDGFADQFGGGSGKKFMSKKFKTLLAKVNKNPLKEQNLIIEQTFSDWKGDLDQVDDVCLVGVRF